MNASCWSLLLMLVCPWAMAADNLAGYPTLDRVIYVQECMRAHPGPEFEMQSKCACTLDQLAKAFPHTEFVTLSTANKATSIGGERGGTLRDNDSVQALVKQFRTTEKRAKQACFIDLARPP